MLPLWLIALSHGGCRLIRLLGEWGEPQVMMDMATAALFVRRAAAMPVPPPLPDSVGIAFLRLDASALCSSDRALLP